MKYAGKNIYVILVVCCLLFSVQTKAQNDAPKKQEKHKLSFKDPQDGAFDVSEWIIDYNGFIPMPIIITEPALGGFGGALVPIFIKQNKPVEVDGKIYPMPPNTTAAFGGYTLNGSWAVGAGRMAVIPKWKMRYTVGAAYMDVNMNYYFTVDKLNKDVDVEFNIKAIPIYLSAVRELKDPRFTLGLEYMFMHSDLEVVSGSQTKWNLINELNQKIAEKISDDISGNIGKFGFKGSFDKRDNTFTPNRGFKINVNADWSNKIFGSDYNYGQFEEAFYWFIPITDKWVNGFRFDIQQIAGDQPFYLRPYIDMRGIPTARYSGKFTALTELEERWDFYRRWSLTAFGGGGKAFDDFSSFSDAEWAYAGGGGFRYLIARRLNLRMGMDFAWGTEGFAYYFVFGSAWIRQ